MYVTISFIMQEPDRRAVQQLPWSVANQAYAEQYALDGRVRISAGTFPSTVVAVRDLLLAQLASTDYMAIKYAEGQLSAEEYAPMKLQRQAWRDEYNSLEEGLHL